jgi:hypothetical protein
VSEAEVQGLHLVKNRAMLAQEGGTDRLVEVSRSGRGGRGGRWWLQLFFQQLHLANNREALGREGVSGRRSVGAHVCSQPGERWV